MRDYKFRGKRVDTGEWVYGYLVKQFASSNGYTESAPHIHFWDGDGFVAWEVVPESVGESTSLLDKNGKEIFEGDIIKHGDKVNEVKFPGAGFWLESIEGEHFMPNDREVIGNVWQNPDLLSNPETKTHEAK